MSSWVRGISSAVEPGELDEPPQDARLRADEQRLDEQLALPAQAAGEQPDEHVVHRRVVAPEPVEVRARDRERLPGLERDDAGRPRGAVLDERQLAERVAWALDGDRDRVAELRRHAAREPAADDEVQRVGGIVPVEHHLVPPEAPPAGDGDEAPQLRFRQLTEQMLVGHAGSVTAVTDFV